MGGTFKMNGNLWEANDGLRKHRFDTVTYFFVFASLFFLCLANYILISQGCLDEIMLLLIMSVTYRFVIFLAYF
jgi:hypothetical protein